MIQKITDWFNRSNGNTNVMVLASWIVTFILGVWAGWAVL